MPSKKNGDPLELERRREVARVIQDHLDATGLSVQQLADQAESSISALYNVLNLKKSLGTSLMQKLINAKVDKNSLYRAAGFPAEHDIHDATVLRIAKRIARLPKDRRDIVDDVIDGLLETLKKKK